MLTGTIACSPDDGSLVDERTASSADRSTGIPPPENTTESQVENQLKRQLNSRPEQLTSSLTESLSDDLAGTSCVLESPQNADSCTDSLQLANAALWFKEASRFRMVAQYQACFQRESVTMTGSYRRLEENDSGQQLELQATSIEGSNIADPQLARVIGKVDLDADGSRGRYTDSWALQRMPSYARALAPVASIYCERTP